MWPAGPSEIKDVPSPRGTEGLLWGMLGLKGWGFFWLSWEDESGSGFTADPKANRGGRSWAAQYQALASRERGW